MNGTSRALRTDDEIEEAKRAQLLPWTATPKPQYVRVLPSSLTGRRFRFGPEPTLESGFS